MKLVIYVKQEQAIAFRSHILVYENLTVTANNQYSIIFFIYSTVIKQNWPFETLFFDNNLDLNGNHHYIKKVDPIKKYSDPIFSSEKKLTNSRWDLLGKYYYYILNCKIYYININL